MLPETCRTVFLLLAVFADDFVWNNEHQYSVAESLFENCGIRNEIRATLSNH
jgi:hypothetical protein